MVLSIKRHSGEFKIKECAQHIFIVEESYFQNLRPHSSPFASLMLHVGPVLPQKNKVGETREGQGRVITQRKEESEFWTKTHGKKQTVNMWEKHLEQ